MMYRTGKGNTRRHHSFYSQSALFLTGTQDANLKTTNLNQDTSTFGLAY